MRITLVLASLLATTSALPQYEYDPRDIDVPQTTTVLPAKLLVSGHLKRYADQSVLNPKSILDEDYGGEDEDDEYFEDDYEDGDDEDDYADYGDGDDDEGYYDDNLLDSIDDEGLGYDPNEDSYIPEDFEDYALQDDEEVNPDDDGDWPETVVHQDDDDEGEGEVEVDAGTDADEGDQGAAEEEFDPDAQDDAGTDGSESAEGDDGDGTNDAGSDDQIPAKNATQLEAENKILEAIITAMSNKTKTASTTTSTTTSEVPSTTPASTQTEAAATDSETSADPTNTIPDINKIVATESAELPKGIDDGAVGAHTYWEIDQRNNISIGGMWPDDIPDPMTLVEKGLEEMCNPDATTCYLLHQRSKTTVRTKVIDPGAGNTLRELNIYVFIEAASWAQGRREPYFYLMKQLVNASTWWNATEYNAQKQVGGGYMGSSITIDDYRTAQFVSIPSYWKIYLSLDGGRGNTDTLHVRFDYEWAPQPADLGCILIQGLIDIFTSVATPYMKGFGFLGQLAGPPAVC